MIVPGVRLVFWITKQAMPSDKDILALQDLIELMLDINDDNSAFEKLLALIALDISATVFIIFFLTLLFNIHLLYNLVDLKSTAKLSN
jgi:hypothetical protein|tara:strand:- start:299 stop:562 length:264 start_codon:yes stop_codon:yes gene_type:complete